MNASLVVSIIALIISLISPIYSYIMSKKVNDINLKSEYIKDTYKEFLTKRIPEARRYVSFNDNTLTGIGKLQNELIELRRALYFYKYSENDFYMDIKIKIQTLEDFVVNNEGCKFDDAEIENMQRQIEEMLTDIYESMNNKYNNG